MADRGRRLRRTKSVLVRQQGKDVLFGWYPRRETLTVRFTVEGRTGAVEVGLGDLLMELGVSTSAVCDAVRRAAYREGSDSRTVRVTLAREEGRIQ